MKNIFISAIILFLLFTITSCNYLDIMPDELPTEDDAFANRNTAKGYLYSCYSFMPNPRHATLSLDLWTADEIVSSFEHEKFAEFPKGNYSSSDPVLNDWNDLFTGIRQCYILLNRIDEVPDLDKSTAELYKAEATFLIAYYHFLLLRSYGPTILVKELPDINISDPSKYAGRATYDESVEWIVGKFQEAIDQGLKSSFGGSDYGRATSTAAKSLIARTRLYAASPLFNGAKSSFPETDDLTGIFNDFRTKEGELMISITYDARKWELAAAAYKDAIELAEYSAYKLYDTSELKGDVKAPEDETECALRMNICDKLNMEIIWPYCIKEDGFALQNKSTPFDPDRDASWNGISPTRFMIETFYTENGLPIDEDPAYYNKEEQVKYSMVIDKHGMGNRLNLNNKREPRFYAWVSFHNGYYEIKNSGKNEQVKIMTQFRKNDNSGKKSRSTNYSPTGYLNKKGVHPNYQQGPNGGGLVHYPWPLIRLAELYLGYAEALIEVGGDNNLELAKTYIDKVRNRAGLKSLDDSWRGIATLDQDKLRQIVRQERTIELYMENHRFWDVRRWLLGTKYLNVRPQGMNIEGEKDADFFKFVEVNVERKFDKDKNYLMPIPIDDINRNPNVIQNPNYF